MLLHRLSDILSLGGNLSSQCAELPKTHGDQGSHAQGSSRLSSPGMSSASRTRPRSSLNPGTIPGGTEALIEIDVAHNPIILMTSPWTDGESFARTRLQDRC